MMAKHKGKLIAKIPRKGNGLPITLAATPWDQGADGLANRVGLVRQERGEVDLATGRIINPNRVFGKVRMPVYQRYHRQKRITAEHAAAAQRLYAAWAGYATRDPLAALSAHVDGGGDDDPNVAMIDRRREFYALWANVPKACRHVLEQVVLRDTPISALPGGSRPEQAAEMMARLAEGLDAMLQARH